ncbi:MAG: hypothetical protein Ct9H300mP11_29560 [Chloroflexota bacterium]|nr:MAG: hypothetical protein Ct9H300mP11_29560 [Chloroflexota bacterium]
MDSQKMLELYEVHTESNVMVSMSDGVVWLQTFIAQPQLEFR